MERPSLEGGGNRLLSPSLRGARTVNTLTTGHQPKSDSVKLLASVILCRLHNMCEKQTVEGKAGFRAGRLYVDQIFNLRQL